MIRILTFCLIAFAAASHAPAQNVPMAQGLPFDAVVFGEINLTRGLRGLTDFAQFEQDGAIGLSYDDMAGGVNRLLQAKDPESGVSGEELEDLIRGTKKLGFGLIDITLSGPTWLATMEHENPQTLIDMLEVAAEAKSILFQRDEEQKDYNVWSIQVPEDWISIWNMLFNQRRFFMWGRIDIERYTEPLFMSVWDDRYILVASRKNDLLDALEYYEYPEDDEFSLAGNRAYRDAAEDLGQQDVFVFWNLDSTIKKLERVWGANEWTKDYLDTMYAVVELKQFRAVTATLKYDQATGTMDSAFQLSFYNRPSWIEVLPFDPRPTPLTDFCPAQPASFTALSIADPASVLERVVQLVGEKGEAVGSPEAGPEMKAALKKFAEANGFSVEEILGMVGPDFAAISINPYAGGPAPNRGAGIAFVASLRDPEAANTFIHEKLLTSPEMRPFFHVTDRRFLDLGEFGRVGYTVFSADTSDSFAWLILDGHLVCGNHDAVVEVIRARRTGNTLANSPRWQAYSGTIPARGLMTSYGDYSFLSEHANAVFPNREEQVNNSGGDEIWWGEVEEPTPEPGPEQAHEDEQSLAAKIFTRHIKTMTSASMLLLEDRNVDMVQRVSGLPTPAEFSAMVATITRHNAWREAQRILTTRVGPALMGHLMEHGNLPNNLQEAATAIGDLSDFRDPNLAGSGKPEILDQDCFVLVPLPEGRSVLPAVPLAHSRQAGELDRWLLLMSDGSVHRVTRDELDRALADAPNAEQPPRFRSSEPQTLREALPALKVIAGQ